MRCKRADCLAVFFLVTALPLAVSSFAQSSGPESDAAAGQAPGDQPPSKPNPFSKMFSDIKSKLASDLGGGASSGSAGLPPDIEHFFRKAPYDTSKPIDMQYPRVAVTVLSSPANHTYHPLSTMIGQVKGCWKLSVTVWSSDTTSKSVGPIDECMHACLPCWLLLVRLAQI
jgi:hypothetical protein